MPLTDVKGTPIEVDSLVEGFTGMTEKKSKGRVYFISPFGWVAYLDELGRQHISYEKRFLVRDKPRPLAKRTDIPERLKR